MRYRLHLLLITLVLGLICHLGKFREFDQKYINRNRLVYKETLNADPCTGVGLLLFPTAVL